MHLDLGFLSEDDFQRVLASCVICENFPSIRNRQLDMEREGWKEDGAGHYTKIQATCLPNLNNL